MGYLAIVLHAHLPFIRHPEKVESLEERWLFETITECYIPLLDVVEKLYEDAIDFRLTVSLSPPLITMLSDPLLMDRYAKYLDSMIELGLKEIRRTAASPEFQSLAWFYLKRLQFTRDVFLHKYQCNILRGFKNIHNKGKVELITSAATHGYLPLMRTDEAKRAQVSTGVNTFTRCFGFSPDGFWLPECGYSPGVEKFLAECGLQYFFVDTHGLLYANPRPRYGVYAPVSCKNKVAVFGRDPESSRQVWDRHAGYPGDYSYREFYRDIAYDLDFEYLKAYLPGSGIRVDTGFKYYRITGQNSRKEPYVPEVALGKAAGHADNFVFNRRRQARYYASRMDRKPMIIAPYDAELFGHWWFEGPQWLNFLCRKIHEQDEIRMITPSGYLAEYPESQAVEMTMSSWGEEGYNLVWLNPANDWVYEYLHQAEVKMRDYTDLYADAGGVEKRALNQAARELLLAQSSDWCFIMRMGTVVQYAEERLKSHLANFNLLADQAAGGQINEVLLSGMEQSINIFPDLDYHVYSRHIQAGNEYALNSQGRIPDLPENLRLALPERKGFRILMLSWEYPPETVGGLGRHVYDISHALASYGDEVHVVTCPATGKSDDCYEDGVHVHRVSPEHLNADDFMTWVKQLNSAMITTGSEIVSRFGPFSVVHVHDWLVEEAGIRIGDCFEIPLLATIHATEYGRNRGLHNGLQQHIHSLEKQLTNKARLVITCSRYMAREVASLFSLPATRVRVVPNGVNPANLYGKGGIGLEGNMVKKRREEKPTILFFGRLVPEKGVQVLLESIPLIASRVPDVHLLVAGRGPYEEHLKDLSMHLGINNRVSFVGFLSEKELAGFLQQGWAAAFPSLYEPFGIVVLEAMATGVPVVVSDTGGLQDVIEHGVDGYKAPPGRADLLAFYLSELLANPVLASDFGYRALRKVQTVYDWHYIAAMTRDIYQELTD